MRKPAIKLVNRKRSAATTNPRSTEDDDAHQPVRRDAAVRSETALRATLPADRQQEERQVQAPRRARRRTDRTAEREVAPWRSDQGSEDTAQRLASAATASEGASPAR